MKVKLDSSIRALIFDCDGTLVHTIDAHMRAWDNIFKKYEINLPSSYLSSYNSVPSRIIVEDINRDTGSSFNPLEIAKEKEDLVYDFLDEVQTVDPVVEYVHAYSGRLPMSVISGGFRKNVIKSLEAVSLSKYFNPIIGADDDHPPKTHPESFIKLAEIMGVSPELCVVFEDGDVGLDNAIRAGMHVIDVREL